MPIYIETIISQWLNDEKNLSILNGIVRHLSDRQIANEAGLRIDRVTNYRWKLKNKGLFNTGFYNIDHEKLGLIQVMDFPKERPSTDDTFLTFMARISRPFGYLRARMVPPHMVKDGYQLGAGVDVLNDFSTPFVVKDFKQQFEEIYGQVEFNAYSKNGNQKKDVDLLSIFICKEVQRGRYRASTLSKVISQQISEDELGVKPSIGNVNERLKQLKKDGVVFKSNPFNVVPLRPYYSFDSAIVKKNECFYDTLAALAELNVVVRYADIIGDSDKSYISLQYNFNHKWDMLRILKEKLEEITFFDHAPYEARRTIPYEYFKDILCK
jgi:hypothetical protein